MWLYVLYAAVQQALLIWLAGGAIAYPMHAWRDVKFSDASFKNQRR